MSGNIFFPDNDKRERRGIELVTDINSSLSRILDAESDINEKIKLLSQTAQDMVHKLEPNAGQKLSTIELYKVEIVVANIVAPALAFQGAYKALAKAVATRVLSNAVRDLEPGVEMAVRDLGAAAPEAEAAAQELSIPLRAKVAGGVGGAILSVAIGFAIDAISGAVARDRLRDNIHDLVPRRITQQLNEMHVLKLQEMVSALLDAYKMMQSLGYTKEQMELLIQNNIKTFQGEFDRITEAKANADLASLDASRDSFTSEDRP